MGSLSSPRENIKHKTGGITLLSDSVHKSHLPVLWNTCLGRNLTRVYQGRGFPGGSEGKASVCNAGDPVPSLGWEDLLEEEIATHSDTLAWKIPWWRSLVDYSPCSCKESDTTELLHFFTPRKIKIIIVNDTNGLIIFALEKVMKAVGMDPCPILDWNGNSCPGSPSGAWLQVVDKALCLYFIPQMGRHLYFVI